MPLPSSSSDAACDGKRDSRKSREHFANRCAYGTGPATVSVPGTDPRRANGCGWSGSAAPLTSAALQRPGRRPPIDVSPIPAKSICAIGRQEEDCRPCPAKPTISIKGREHPPNPGPKDSGRHSRRSEPCTRAFLFASTAAGALPDAFDSRRGWPAGTKRT